MGTRGRTVDKVRTVGGQFDFDDGGSYCGGWDDGKAHGHGVCTGPEGKGEYSGRWMYGFEISGVYIWPSVSDGGSVYGGQWQNGKRHGLGTELRGRWLYRGEWTSGSRGRYGVRQSTFSIAKYEGTWSNGLQDGYGSETYADTGIYKGQWLRGLRHGYGVRTSAAFSQASVIRHNLPDGEPATSMRREGDPLVSRDKKVDMGRGGFVLRSSSTEVKSGRRGSLTEKSTILSVFKGLKIRRQRSTGDIQTSKGTGSIRSTASTTSWMSTDSGRSAYTTGDAPAEDGSNTSFIVDDEQLDPSIVETYMGEWKNDKRNGFGVCERSDGLKYEGEWFNNRKYGYGVTTFKDCTSEEGKYKNNILVASTKRKNVFIMRSAKFRERIETAVEAAQRTSKLAMQKEDIAISRTATARMKAEQADIAEFQGKEDSTMARQMAREIGPDFYQPGLDIKKYGLDMSLMAKAALPKPPEAVILPEFIPEDTIADEPVQSDLPSPGYANIGLNNQSDGKRGRRTSTGSLMDNHMDCYDIGEPLLENAVARGRSSVRGDKNRKRTTMSSAIMNDRLDHYNRPPSRPPSRDRSMDRFATRSQTPVPAEIINHGSRAPSTHRTSDRPPQDVPSVGQSIAGSRRPSRPTSVLPGECLPLTGNGSIPGLPYHIPVNQREAESMLRQRICGQEIIPNMTQLPSVKRTESLYINPVMRHQEQAKASPVTTLKRKKSLPDSKPILPSQVIMSREEASVLSSHQRETVRRNIEESEKYRANPLLYLTSPAVQDFFSRQRLLMLILILNLSLAYIFFKLLS